MQMHIREGAYTQSQSVQAAAQRDACTGGDRGSVCAEAYRGVRKGRWALLEAGRQHPDLVDSGASDWDESMYGEELGRKKGSLTFAQQVPRLAALLVYRFASLVMVIQCNAEICA